MLQVAFYLFDNRENSIEKNIRKITIYLGLGINSKYKSELQEYLSKNSHCEDISIPLFHSFLQPIPPIFIDVNVKIKTNVRLPKWSILSGKLNIVEKNKCLSEVAKILNLKHLSKASHKSTKAATHLFW